MARSLTVADSGTPILEPGFVYPLEIHPIELNSGYEMTEVDPELAVIVPSELAILMDQAGRVLWDADYAYQSGAMKIANAASP